ncbi:MAG: hypothetical protein U0835_22755 [Isosphaeraceae bacterium]
MPPRYFVGRFLQLIGLLILPFAIASELMEKVGLGQSMLVAAAGAGIFYTGYVIQNQTPGG